MEKIRGDGKMMEIYYIEDDENIATAVKEYLCRKGYEVSIFGMLESGKKAIECHIPNIVLIDWNMPDGGGDSFCRWIRSNWKELPIIFLTVRNDTRDIISGFEDGADDYVTKPFSPKEVMARINAVTKRRKGEENNKDVITYEGLTIDMVGRNVYVDGEKAELTPKEYEILFYFVKNKGIALTREKLLLDVWGFDFYGDDRTVDTHIKMLRSNLKQYRKFIVTLRGMGYKFEV